MATPRQAAPAPHIPSLDGLRTTSIAIVFLSHVGLHAIMPGLFGVTIFFFLSGYLITTLLRLEYDANGGINFRQFYFRRALRILPPCYLVLATTLLLARVGWLHDPANAGWAAQALFMANYYEIFGSGSLLPGTEVYWSLAVEEHFYLLFPFVYVALRRRLPQPAHQAIALLALCAAVLAWRCELVFGLSDCAGGQHNPRTCHASDTRIDAILFGCVLAVWGNPALDATRFGRRAWLWGWLPAGLALLLVTFLVTAHPTAGRSCGLAGGL